MWNDDRPVRLGRLVAAHGIRGEVKVQPYGDRAEGLLQPRRIRLVDDAGQSRWFAVLSGRVQGRCAILALEGVRDRTAAEELVGLALEVERERLPPLAPEEYYWHDLLGLVVRGEDGQELGRVIAIHATGAHDVVEVGGAGREYLLPYTASFIVRQDGREIIMRLPPGLLEIND